MIESFPFSFVSPNGFPTMNLRPALIVVALVASQPAALAQAPARPKGVLNLNWGATRAEVLTVLRQQGVAVPEEDPGGDKLVGEGGTFAGQQAVSWTFEFAGGKFFNAAVVLRPAESGASLYRELKQSLIAKYGPHSSEKKLGNTPEERRARALYGSSGVKRGTAVTWKFGPTLQSKDSLSITCELSAPESAESEDDALNFVTLRYTNESVKSQSAAVAAAAAAVQETPAKTTRPVKGDCL